MDPVLSNPGEDEIMAANKAIAKKIAKDMNKRIEDMIKKASSMYDEIEKRPGSEPPRATLRYASAPPDKEKSVGGWIRKALGLKALGLDVSEYQPSRGKFDRHSAGGEIKPSFPGLKGAIKTAVPPREKLGLDMSGYHPSGDPLDSVEIAEMVKKAGGVPPAGTPGVSPGPHPVPTYSPMPATGTHPLPSIGMMSGGVMIIDDLQESLIPKADNAFCLSVGPDLDLDFRDFAMFCAREPDGLEVDLGLFIHIAGIAVAEDTQHIYCPVTGLKYPFSKLIGRYT